MHLIHRTTCRVCGSPILTPVIHLGSNTCRDLSSNRARKSHRPGKFRCRWCAAIHMRDERACRLLQMEHSVPPDILYSAYWYRSGTNNTMREHLRGIAVDAAEISGRTSGSILDIGCNDGTLLSYYPDSFEKYGIDPSDVAHEISNQVRFVQDIFPSGAHDPSGGAQVGYHPFDRHVLRSGGPNRLYKRDQGNPRSGGHLDFRDVVHADDVKDDLL